MPTEDRTLAALGLDVVPHGHPLEYPGARPRESGLLDGDRLPPLDRWASEDRGLVVAIGSNARRPAAHTGPGAAERRRI